MADVIPFDPTTVTNVADVEPHYEAKAAVMDVLDVLVDPETMRNYTFQFVTDWGTLFAAAGDVYTAGSSRSGRRNKYSWEAIRDRGIEPQWDSEHAIDDIVHSVERFRSGDYQTYHPFMPPALPSFYVDLRRERPPVATEDEALQLVGALVAERLARFEAFETFRSDPNFADWMPRSTDAYIRSYELDHISALFDESLTLGSAGRFYTVVSKEGTYGRPAPHEQTDMKLIDLEAINSPAIAVSILKTAFRLYDTMTAHYDIGLKLEERDPVDIPEIALAHEYIYTANNLAERFKRRYNEHKTETDRRYAHMVASGVEDGESEETARGYLRLRDMYGDALAGLQDVHENAVFALSLKLGSRIDMIERAIGKPIRVQKHRERHSGAYVELNEIRRVLQSATSSEGLPINSVLQDEVDAIIAHVNEYCEPEELFSVQMYRYNYHSRRYEGYDGRREKRFYRNYPPNRDAVHNKHALV